MAPAQVRAWDAQTGDQVKKVTEHDSHVNSVCPMRRGPPLFTSGSDDATVKVWDPINPVCTLWHLCSSAIQNLCQVWDQRAKRSVMTFKDRYQVTSVAFADAGDQVFSGGLDNTIKVCRGL